MENDKECFMCTPGDDVRYFFWVLRLDVLFLVHFFFYFFLLPFHVSSGTLLYRRGRLTVGSIIAVGDLSKVVAVYHPSSKTHRCVMNFGFSLALSVALL